ncbi:MAG: rhombosortase [Pseudomonadota bacterium]
MGLLKALGRADTARLLLLFIVVVTAIVIELAGDIGRDILRYQRDRVFDGEWWRLVSGHFAHLGPQHLALNLAGLALVAVLVGRALTAGAWLLAILVSLLAVNAGFLLFNPELRWYVGLSGVLHGLLTAGLIAGLGSRRKESLLLLAVIAGKLAWEQLAGALPGSSSVAGGAVVVDAHLYGALGGTLVGAILISLRRRASL